MKRSVNRCWFAVALVGGSTLGMCVFAGEPEPGSQGPGSQVLATWKGGQLTEDEFDSWQEFRGHPTVGTLSEETRADSIRELVFMKSLAETATADGLEETRGVRLELEAMRRSVLVPVLRGEVVADVSVSDQEVDAVYRDHPEAFRKPRKLKLRNIYQGYGGDSDEAEVREHMRQIHRELVAGADFGELATRESESQSATRGGALGWVDPNELPPPVAEVVRTLAPGGISGPVEHGSGISIFKCEDVREARAPTPAEVRGKLRAQLERLRIREAWDQYQESLLGEASPRIDPGSLTAVLELPGYRLDGEDLKALVALQAVRTGVAPAAEQMGELLRSWALGVLEVRQAQELGLDTRPETAEKLRWRRLEILAQAELARRLQAELPEPSDDELRAFFEDNRRRYSEPAAYDLGLIDFGELDSKAAVEQAMSVARQVSAGELSFEEAARRYSKHSSARSGGGIGWRTTHQVALWGPTASRAILQLRPGETTGLLHLESGFKIYTLLGQRGARVPSFDDLKEQVRTAWLNQQLPELEAKVRLRQLDHINLAIRLAGAEPPRVIRWSTATEFENYGYHVYRGMSLDGPFERLTEEPILGAGTSDLPHSYQYDDVTASPGTVYYYYVEAISTSGQTRRLTPVRASTGTAP